MDTKLCAGLVWLACSLALSPHAEGQQTRIQIVGDKVIISKIGEIPKIITIPSKPNSPSPDMDADKRDVGTLISEAWKTAGYMWEAKRQNQARSEAEAKLRNALGGGASYAAVAVVASHPIDPSKTPDDIEFFNTYTVREAATGGSREELIRNTLGPVYPEIKEASESGVVIDSESLYPRYILVGQIDQNTGALKTSFLTAQEQDQYFLEQTKKAAKVAKEQADKAEAERKAADAKAAAENSAAAEQAAEQKRKDELAAKQRSDTISSVSADIYNKAHQRDDICRNGRTAACDYADDSLTNDFDAAEKNVATALCMSPQVGVMAPSAPSAGPCSLNAPPCKVCSSRKAATAFDVFGNITFKN